MSALHLAQLAGGLLAITSLVSVLLAFVDVRLTRRDVFVAAAHPVAAGLTWAALSGPFEGRVLLRLSTSHGLTAADVLVVLPLTAAGVLVTRIWR